MFKTYFDAFTTLEFLNNQNNIKEDSTPFQVRWFREDDELLVSNGFKKKLQQYNLLKFNFQEHVPSNFRKNNAISFMNKINFTDNYNYSNLFSSNGSHTSTLMREKKIMLPPTSHSNSMKNVSSVLKDTYKSHNNIPNYEADPKLRNPPVRNFNSSKTVIMNNNYYSKNINSLENEGPSRKYSNNTIDEKLSPDLIFREKFTCKYEIQIENDSEFQVARKLIGPKVKLK